MPQKVLAANLYLIGQSYPTIASETVIEIKQGTTWDEEFFVQGDFTGWNINFYIAKQSGETRIATGRIEGLQFGNFTVEGTEYENYTYFKLIIDSNITAEMDITPIAIKEISQPKAGRDYWQADLEASKTIATKLIVRPLAFDLTPVVVRGQV